MINLILIRFPLCLSRLIWFICIFIKLSFTLDSKDQKTREFSRNQLFWLKDFFIFAPHWCFREKSFLSRRITFLINQAAVSAKKFNDGSDNEIDNWKFKLNCFFSPVESDVIHIQDAPAPTLPGIRLAGDLEIH